MFKVKLMGAVAALVTVAALAPAGLAAGSGATVVTGSSHATGFNLENRIFTFAGVQLPNGTVTGQANLVLASAGRRPIHLHLRLTCMSLSGDQALLGGVVTGASDPGALGLTALVAVQDDPDLVSPLLIDDPETGPLDCTSLSAGDLLSGFAFPGNVTIQ